ncbi:MAG: RHS repeat protein [Treponema sp.]|nr:RHS repeat protein [Candidatus Treponema equifaecale]
MSFSKIRTKLLFLAVIMLSVFATSLHGEDGGSESGSGSDSGGGDNWWDSYEPEPEDGWDGTINTGWDFNDDIIWADDFVPWTDEDYENYIILDGEKVGYDDLYDANGTLQYKSDDSALLDRIDNFFSSMKASSSGDAEYFARTYSNSIKAVDYVKMSYAPEWYNKAYENMTKAQDILSKFCEENEFVWSVKGNSVSIKNSEGIVIAHAGDPVVISSGQFVIDDVDAVLSFGGFNFPIQRHYRSPSEEDSKISKMKSLDTGMADRSKTCKKNGGAFGPNWYSIFDTRLIFGYANDFSFALYGEEYWHVTKLKEAEDEIKEAVNEDPSARALLLQIQLLKAQCNQRVEDIYQKALDNNAIKNRNMYVEYGFPENFAKKLGWNGLIYCGDDDSLILLTASQGNSFKPKSAYWKNQFEIRKIGNEYEATFSNSGETRIYSSLGLPLKILYKNGMVIEFSYNKSSQIESVTINGKNPIYCTWEKNRITCLEQNGLKTFFSYDGDYLKEVKKWNGDTKKFEYDEKGYITKQIKADGSFIEFEYKKFSTKKCVSSTINENKEKESFQYSFSEKNTTYTDHDGYVYSYYYDQSNRTKKVLHPDGTVEKFDYDSYGKLNRWERDSKFIVFNYDNKGRLIKKAYSDGSYDLYSFSNGNLVLHTNRNGINSRFVYGANDCISQIYYGEKLLYALAYNSDKLLSEVTDFHGNKNTYSYDGNGNLAEHKLFSPGSSTPSAAEKWSYDEHGRVKEFTDFSGIIWKYEYSSHESTVTDGKTVRISKAYSPRNLLISEKTEDLITGEIRCKEYEYNAVGKCTEIYVSGTDTDGKVVPRTLYQNYKWSAEGKILSVAQWDVLNPAASVSVAGWLNSYEYDKSGYPSAYLSARCDSDMNLSDVKEIQLSSIKTSGGSMMQENGDFGEIEYHYDVEDRLLKKVINGTTQFENEYSTQGSLLNTNYGPYSKINFKYDSTNGFLSGIGSGESDEEKSEVKKYPDGKIKYVKNLHGLISNFKYNEFGQLVGIENPIKKVLYDFDKNNRICRKIIKDSSEKIIYEESWTYSKNGREIKHCLGTSYFETAMLNCFGNIISRTDCEGNETKFCYDILGRKIVQQDVNGRRTLYSYNGKNKITKIVYPDGRFNELVYDNDQNLIEVRDGEGVLLKQSFDKFGRITSQGERPFLNEKKFYYDDFGRVVRSEINGRIVVSENYKDGEKTKKWSNGSNTDIEYGFDSNGRLLWAQNSSGKKQSYSYNTDGTFRKRIDFNGNEAVYSYGNDGLSCTVNYSDGSAHHSEYDAVGNLLCVKNGDSELCFSYDTAGKLLSQSDKRNGHVLNFKYNSRGLMSEISDEKRKVRYSYGKTGKIVLVEDGIKTSGGYKSSEVAFSYDDEGRETLRLWKTGESIRSIYDSAGRLVLKSGYSSQMNLIFLEGYVYDQNGFVTLSLDSDLGYTKYEYDDSGHVSAVSYPYTEEKSMHLKKYIASCGLFVRNQNELESNTAISRWEFQQLQKLCGLASGGLISLPESKSFITEKYEYDENENLSRRITPYGIVDFEYGKENRLLQWGNGCSANYDENGNMTEMRDNSAFIKMIYDSQNRISEVEVLNYDSDIYVKERYFYDGFGRMVSKKSTKNVGEEYVYIGFTYTPFYINSGTVKLDEGYESNAISLMRGQGTQAERIRYRWNDSSSAEKNAERSASLKDYGNYRGTVEKLGSDYQYDKAVLSADNSLLSYCNLDSMESENEFILMGSQNGTILKEISNTGIEKFYDYDPFGNPCGANSVFGFVGKHYNRETKLYDFGQRHYFPNINRFSSVDPIHDGRNWYTYCNGDFVNFYDPDGLEMLITQAQYMQSMGDTLLGNSTTEAASSYGCLVTAIAEAMTAFTGYEITPAMINSDPSNFCALNGEISWEDICQNYGLSYSRASISSIIDNYSKDLIGQRYDDPLWHRNNELLFDSINKSSDGSIMPAMAINDFLENLIRDEKDTVVLAQIIYNTEGNTHFVPVGGKVVSKDGIDYIPVIPTSKYDASITKDSVRSKAGWIEHNNKILAPIQNVQRLDTLSKNN